MLQARVYKVRVVILVQRLYVYAKLEDETACKGREQSCDEVDGCESKSKVGGAQGGRARVQVQLSDWTLYTGMRLRKRTREGVNRGRGV